MPGPKILIIEDSRFVCAVLEEGLRAFECEIAVVHDGKEGLRAARKTVPEMVILDLVLPGLPGEEVCRQLKRDARTEKISVVMLTGKASDADRVLGRVLGADAYIPKPFEIEQLRDTVKTLLNL